MLMNLRFRLILLGTVLLGSIPCTAAQLESARTCCSFSDPDRNTIRSTPFSGMKVVTFHQYLVDLAA